MSCAEMPIAGTNLKAWSNVTVFPLVLVVLEISFPLSRLFARLAVTDKLDINDLAFVSLDSNKTLNLKYLPICSPTTNGLKSENVELSSLVAI